MHKPLVIVLLLLGTVTVQSKPAQAGSSYDYQTVMCDERYPHTCQYAFATETKLILRNGKHRQIRHSSIPSSVPGSNQLVAEARRWLGTKIGRAHV